MALDMNMNMACWLWVVSGKVSGEVWRGPCPDLTFPGWRPWAAAAGPPPSWQGLMSKKLYTQIYAACGFSNDKTATPAARSQEEEASCRRLLEAASDEVGPHNVYNIYDNCPRGEAVRAALAEESKSMRWLLHEMRRCAPQPMGPRVTG